MDFVQFITFILVNMAFFLTLWLWNRSESRADHRESRMEYRELREESRQESKRISDLVEAIKDDMRSFQLTIASDMRNFQMAMAQETKDFHGRLCAIEERNKGKGA